MKRNEEQNVKEQSQDNRKQTMFSEGEKMVTTRLDWIRCQNNRWCTLANLDLKQSLFDDLFGVYIIWKKTLKSEFDTIRVGQGFIRDRLEHHRKDRNIMKHGSILHVTFAMVDRHEADGIEVFLANTLEPRVGERFPNAKEISVNLP